jgi:hypothetical protein
MMRWMTSMCRFFFVFASLPFLLVTICECLSDFDTRQRLVSKTICAWTILCPQYQTSNFRHFHHSRNPEVNAFNIGRNCRNFMHRDNFAHLLQPKFRQRAFASTPRYQAPVSSSYSGMVASNTSSDLSDSSQSGKNTKNHW